MTLPAPDAFPGHDGGVWAPVPSQVVASWPVGHFAENLAIDPDGTIFVSFHSHSTIVRVDPASGSVSQFVSLPAPVAGLAFDVAGYLWATGGLLGQAPGIVWRIDRSGVAEEWTTIADAVFLNGCTPHPDGTTLLICESMTGRVIAVDRRSRNSWTNWIADDRLKPSGAQVPGANGIKFGAGAALISVTDMNLIYRSQFATDGTAGPLAVAASDLRADDFAFGASGAAYIATHPAQTVVRLAADGTRTTIAGPDQGAAGSTACAFGRTASDANALYVTTNGGLWSPYRGVPQDAKLLRLDVGEPGTPLLPA